MLSSANTQKAATLKFGRNERKLIMLIAIDCLGNCSAKELHQFLQEKSNWIDAIKLGTVASLLNRYTTYLGLLKREWTPKIFETPKRKWNGGEYRYSLTEKGIQRIIWLLKQVEPDRAPAQSTQTKNPLTFEDLLLIYLLLKRRGAGKLKAEVPSVSIKGVNYLG